MIYVDLEQGSPEWLEFRRSHIGSSDAAIIQGTNRFPGRTPYRLYIEKVEGIEQQDNPAMKRGRELEPVARQMFIDKMSKLVVPRVGVSEERPWQSASFDGISEDGTLIVEIKCGGEDLYLKALQGEIPVYYKTQIQHQFCVSKAVKGYYVAFYEGEIAIVEVFPDWLEIEQMIEKQESFVDMLHKLEPPALSDRDYEKVQDEKGTEMLREYVLLGLQEKQLKERRDALKLQIVNINPKQNFILDGSKIYQKTTVSYNTKKMLEDGIDISKYRSTSKPYWMITSPGRIKDF